MAEFPGHCVPWDTLAAALAAPFIRGHHTTGNHGTVRSKELTRRFQAKPVKAAESSQVRALKGSVEHEGLAVENLDLDNLILYQGPHLYPINAAPGIITEQPRLHPAFGRAR